MKVTKKNIEKFRAEFQAKFIEEFEKTFGSLEDIKAKYSESEWRVMVNSMKFHDLPEAVQEAEIAVDMLYDKWQDIIDLDQYLASGDWQKDYEAEERGELRKDIPKDVLSEDGLYNALQSLDQVLKDMRRLVRHYKTPKKENSKTENTK